MEKIEIKEKIHYYCDWVGLPSLDDIKKDIIELEKLGVTHVNIDYGIDHGTSYVEVEPINLRIETDEEFTQRKLEVEAREKRIAERELNDYNKLKEKLGL